MLQGKSNDKYLIILKVQLQNNFIPRKVRNVTFLHIQLVEGAYFLQLPSQQKEETAVSAPQH